MKGKKEPACTGRRKMLSRFARQVPGVLCFCAAMSIVYACPVFAATNIWTKAKEIMQDVYNQILLIYGYCHCDSQRCPVDDEFFQKRQNRG